MDRYERVIPNIEKFGNKNSCYVPFAGGGVLSIVLTRLRENWIHGHLPYYIGKRL